MTSTRLARWFAPIGCVALALVVASCAEYERTDSGSSSADTGWSSTDTGWSTPDADTDADTDYDDGTDPDADTETDTEDSAVDGECDTTSEVVLYLSADDSNSMAGPAVARGLIRNGQLVNKGLRTYEFLNYYHFDYAPAQAGTVDVTAQMRAHGGDLYNLQIGVRAPDFDEASRRPLNVVLAVDTSSSMGWGRAGSTGIERARDVCAALGGSLRAGDVLSLVSWGDDAAIVLGSHIAAGPADATISSRCASLQAYGDTDLAGGLAYAYQLAAGSFDPARINRVILVSDGGANVGTTETALIASMAEDADGEAIYLMGVGVGDPWNYNDALMDGVTDAGKGSYVFVDSAEEAARLFSESFLSSVEVAAREVRVELVLPPTFEMSAFHGEEYSTIPEEVEPQHLAANDAMIFHQELRSCDASALDADAPLTVTATWRDPVVRDERTARLETSVSGLLAGETALLRKGDAIVEYAEALKELRTLRGTAALTRIDETVATVDAAIAELPGDEDLAEIRQLLVDYRGAFATGFADAYPTGGPDTAPLNLDCSACDGTGGTLQNMRCAIELCDDSVYLSGTITSPTGSRTNGVFYATERFGAPGNDLAPLHGGSYALLATGPALGTSHSVDMGGGIIRDPFSSEALWANDAMEWRLHLKAPANANGFRVSHVFFSEEYDDFVGTGFNDKFYIVIEAGSTNGGSPTVINFTGCRDPERYWDFTCSPGMQYCNPGQKYCYVAINTALSECCWYDGCPDGTATTDIRGTGFECAGSLQGDSDARGSSTGWMHTEWPIEPNEEFFLTFHVHDTSDSIFDSEVILDRLRFLPRVTPGTWQ